MTFEGGPAGETLRRPAHPFDWHALAEVGRRLTGDVRLAVLHVDGLSSETTPAVPPDDHPGMWLQRADLVSIAVLGGEVTGPAADVALMCDLRVFAEDTRFAMTATQLGGVPASGPTLADLIGRSRALELCLTGRWVPAAEAAAIGLATIVVARDDVDAATQDLAAAILSAPRDAVVETTALLRARRLSPAERWSAAVEAEQRLTVGKPA